MFGITIGLMINYLYVLKNNYTEEQKMSKYYCKECGNVTDERDIIPGHTTSEDEYINSTCPECESEDIQEIDSDDICPVCDGYHNEPGKWTKCFEELYSDARGILYIQANWELKETIEIMSELSDGGKSNTLQEIIWDSECGEDFVRYICEFDDNKDMWRNEKLIARLTA